MLLNHFWRDWIMKPNIRYERAVLSIDEIILDKDNPNVMSKEQEKSLDYSIKKFGYVYPIIVDNKTRVIADGEHRLKELKKQGINEVEVFLFDFKDETERRLFRQTANKLRGMHDSVLDDSEYKFIFQNEGFEDLKRLIGEDEKRMVQFLAGLQKDNSKDDSFDVLGALKTPKYEVRIGDKWQLDQHVLLCGDSTVKEDVERLLGGGQSKHGIHRSTV